jgi:MFS transporter, MHS family, citrate/tricarballylate:H+ symporter
MSKVGAVVRVTSGNLLEQFDFFLFGFYAIYIARAFFPSSSEFASLMSTFAVFGAGFFVRPLGAIILGAYIDAAGRRKGLVVTLSIMAAGTILIAAVPGYASIGPLAAVLVLLGRLLQGFSAGVEVGGVSVYLAEMATPGHKGFYTSWQSASQQISIVIAALLGYAINSYLTKAQIAAWGWRIPFLIGCAIVPCIFMLRRSLQETEAFSARRHRPKLGEAVAILSRNWRTVFASVLLVGMTSTTFYFITVYTPTFGRAVLKLSTADSLVVAICVAVSNFIWLPIGGALSDRVGRRALLMAIPVLAIFTSYPVLAWLVFAPTFWRMLIVLLWFSFFYGVYNGAMLAALTEVMPESVRVAGFSLALSLATALFGGITPAVSTYLIEATGNRAAPGCWLIFSAGCGLVATLMLYRRNPSAAWKSNIT